MTTADIVVDTSSPGISLAYCSKRLCIDQKDNLMGWHKKISQDGHGVTVDPRVPVYIGNCPSRNVALDVIRDREGWVARERRKRYRSTFASIQPDNQARIIVRCEAALSAYLRTSGQGGQVTTVILGGCPAGWEPTYYLQARCVTQHQVNSCRQTTSQPASQP